MNTRPTPCATLMNVAIQGESTQDLDTEPETKSTTRTTITDQQQRKNGDHCPTNPRQINCATPRGYGLAGLNLRLWRGSVWSGFLV